MLASLHPIKQELLSSIWIQKDQFSWQNLRHNECCLKTGPHFNGLQKQPPPIILEGFLLHCKVPSFPKLYSIWRLYFFSSSVPQEHYFPILEGFIFSPLLVPLEHPFLLLEVYFFLHPHNAIGLCPNQLSSWHKIFWRFLFVFLHLQCLAYHQVQSVLSLPWIVSLHHPWDDTIASA